jgi:hypothetical protein
MKKIFLSIGLMLGVATAFATTQTKTTQDKPWRVYLLSDVQNKNSTTHYKDEVYENAWGNFEADDDDGTSENQTWVNYNHFWLDGIGGVGGEYNNWQNDYWDYQGNHYGSAGGMTGNITWDETGYGEEIGLNNDGTTITGFTNSSTVWGRIGNEHCNVSDPVNQTWDNDYSAWDDDNDRGSEHDTYTRTADTVWHVQTGGKAIPGRQNLWQFNGSVWEILDKRAVPQFYGANMREVTNKTQIALGSLGNLKADGNLWLTLPDDTEKDITPTVAGKDFFTFSVGGQKYPLTILANGNDLSVTNPVFCAGQQIDFSLDGLPLGSIVSMLGQWGLPTKYVNEQWQHTRNNFGITVPYGSINYRVNSSLLQNTNQTSCWFVNGSGGHVTVGLNLQFPNGQYVSVAANGDFSIIKPHITRIALQNPPFGGTVSVVPGELRLLNNAMSYHAYISKTYPGQFGITQLIKRFYWTILGPTFVPIWSSTHGDYWLDTSEYYDGLTSITLNENEYPSQDEYSSYSDLTDGPGFGMLMIGASCEVHCRDYIRFTPSGSGSIPVTIERVDWSWNSVAEQDTTLTWHVTGDAVTGPDEITDDSFPEWESVDSSIIQWEQ